MELIDKSAPATTSPLGALFSVLYEPSATFSRLASRPMAWLPAITLCLTSSTVMLWYFLGFVDYPWLQERMLEAIADPEARAQGQSMAIGQQAMGMMSLVGAVFGTLMTFLIGGLYYLIVGKFTGREMSFGKGFALSAWASVPMILLLPLGAMQMLLASNGQMPYEALNPTTLNQMIFHYEASHPMAGVLESLSIPIVWSTVLSVIGYQAWTGASRASALRVVLVPTVLLYGAWLAYALSKTA
ncbi:YIP1 family protein [Massilia sp. ST3]|uniref:YIP1 family protein n=1 Tax=Massilia sp. ST3 TaxID=2824903 RepID=UPI001B8D7402|nr:YIP1 family protein [Massilia sp. ST3]